MIWFDYILLAILAYFGIWGFRQGLIKAVGSIVGLVAAVVLASRYFEEVANLAAPYIGLADNLNLARVIAFVALLIAVNQIVMLAFTLIEKAFHAAAVLPFMKLGNRILGAVLGFAEGALALGLVIYFAIRYPFGTVVTKLITESQVAPILLRVADVVQPLIPEAVQRIQGLI